MICRCSKCGELRTTVPLKTGATCSHCLFVESFEPSDHEPPPTVLDGIECGRLVENRKDFALLFVRANSNQEGMVAASDVWGMVEMTATRYGKSSQISEGKMAVCGRLNAMSVAGRPIFNLGVESHDDLCDGLITLLQGLVEQGLELPKIHWIET